VEPIGKGKHDRHLRRFNTRIRSISQGIEGALRVPEVLGGGRSVLERGEDEIASELVNAPNKKTGEGEGRKQENASKNTAERGRSGHKKNEGSVWLQKG